MHRPTRLNLFYKVGSLALMFLVFCGCFKANNVDHQILKNKLDLADSLYYQGKNAAALAQLKATRPQITGDIALLNRYYYLLAQQHWKTPADIDLYADSALALFTDQQTIDKYPAEYYFAALTKGDACLKTSKYVTALDFFDQAKKILPKAGVCDNGDLDSRLGVIYYGQRNFTLAARYWLACYNKLGLCPGKGGPLNIFLTRQGALDNVGVSYQRSGMLDSAGFYYAKQLQIITDAVNKGQVNQPSVNPTLEVLYDNIGGLNLKLGKYDTARFYLNKCLAIPDNETDGARIPPLLKLADLDTRTGNLKEAYQSFGHSKKLLNKFRDGNIDLEMSWKRLYAAYLEKSGRRDSTFYYLDQYIALKELNDKNSIALYRLNVQRELDGMQQQRSLAELSQKDKVKKLYLQGIGVGVILSLVIIYLVYRNLKKARKNHHVATLRNQQLKQTLIELERANQNYIRIMRVMAHDLRNPISGMIGLATVLQMEKEYNAESKHMLQLIESTGTHSIEMINELLKTGLADENEQIVTQNIDLKSLLYDSVELLQFKAKEKGQKIIFNATEGSVMADANHEKMWRVFNNLIVNAIKFSHEGGEIKVSITTAPRQVLISVADSGIGIPPENKDSVFEMFTSAKKVGTDGEQPFGLGLSISKRIVEMHHGKIWFDSSVGVGSTFFISLPFTQ